MLRKTMIGAAIALAIASIAGCSGSSNNDPNTRTIGPAGGGLSAALGIGTATVTFAPNALTSNTRVSLVPVPDSNLPPPPATDKPILPGTAVKITPAISSFNGQQVTLRITYTEAEIAALNAALGLTKSDASLVM